MGGRLMAVVSIRLSWLLHNVHCGYCFAILGYEMEDINPDHEAGVGHFYITCSHCGGHVAVPDPNSKSTLGE